MVSDKDRGRYRTVDKTVGVFGMRLESKKQLLIEYIVRGHHKNGHDRVSILIKRPFSTRLISLCKDTVGITRMKNTA